MPPAQLRPLSPTPGAPASVSPLNRGTFCPVRPGHEAVSRRPARVGRGRLPTSLSPPGLLPPYPPSAPSVPLFVLRPRPYVGRSCKTDVVSLFKVPSKRPLSLRSKFLLYYLTDFIYRLIKEYRILQVSSPATRDVTRRRWGRSDLCPESTSTPPRTSVTGICRRVGLRRGITGPSGVVGTDPSDYLSPLHPYTSVLDPPSEVREVDGGICGPYGRV